MFETPGIIIMTIAATRMHRSLVTFASSNVYDSSLPSFFLLTTACIVLGCMRVPKWVVSDSQRPSRQTPLRLSRIGLRWSSTRPSNSIRKVQRVLMTQPPSSAQVSKCPISLMIHQSSVWPRQLSPQLTVFRRHRASNVTRRLFIYFVVLYCTCTRCITSLSGAGAPSRRMWTLFFYWYYHVFWVAKRRGVAKCGFLRDRNIVCSDLSWVQCTRS
jgi:hypothetical protein